MKEKGGRRGKENQRKLIMIFGVFEDFRGVIIYFIWKNF